MRGHEYLAAIVSEGSLLRLAILRHADELRSPADVGLPKARKVTAKGARAVEKAIDDLTREKLDMDELSDRYAEAVSKLVASKEEKDDDVVKTSGADIQDEPASADVLDLMKALRERVSPRARVTTADGGGGSDTPFADNIHHLPSRRKRRRRGHARSGKKRRAA